tara:strand:+ start:1269 stop:1604 length:336 start_codon:yes stop_codon:yes gene_type:complete
LKTNSLKIKTITICINVLILVAGAVSNPVFIPIALCYMVAISAVYYFGSKIKDVAINVGYIWFSKWTMFTSFLILTGVYAPDIFLYALTLFVVFNISVNPTSLMFNKKAPR